MSYVNSNQKKEDKNRTRITVWGNHIIYSWDVGTKTGSLKTVKLFAKSVISRPVTWFDRFDVYKLPPNPSPPLWMLSHQPPISQKNLSKKYILIEYVHGVWKYFDIYKVVYGLPQAGMLTNNLLKTFLNIEGNKYQATTTPGLWCHKWRPILFILAVDNFGI